MAEESHLRKLTSVRRRQPEWKTKLRPIKKGERMAVKSFAVKGNFPLGIEAERNPPFNFSRSNCHSTHRPTRLSFSLSLSVFFFLLFPAERRRCNWFRVSSKKLVTRRRSISTPRWEIVLRIELPLNEISLFFHVLKLCSNDDRIDAVYECGSCSSDENRDGKENR